VKRLLCVILCIGLVITGCQTRNKVVQKEIVPLSQTKNAAKAVLKTNAKWSAIKIVDDKKQGLTIPKYEANVKPYTIAEDLSNVENIKRFNGFTKEQKNMIVKNGFVVLPGEDTKSYYVYDTNEYQGIPNFITADTVLGMYHQFYDKSLMHIESSCLYKDLEQMTKQMLSDSIRVYHVLKEADLKNLQKNNVAYFMVASMLMAGSNQVAADVPDEVLGLARQEYALITAQALAKSKLLKIDLDYSQFKIRGHYTKSKELGKLFQTMMWYGLVPYALQDKEGAFEYENTKQAILMAYTTFLEGEKTCSAELWSKIYQPTGQYVGLSDDVNVFTMNSIRVSVFGEDTDPNCFNDQSYYAALKTAVEDLPQPQIQAKIQYLTTPAGKQFRFMGQRYVMDSYIMQQLVDPNARPLPSALDVMGVLGSSLAEHLQFEVNKPQEVWPKYTENYNKLKTEVSTYKEDLWSNNLYNGWLWSIQAALKDYPSDSGMPFFMTTDAWKSKSLNAALGSYTELKHDTVLYGKQAVAEMGGPADFATQHYVEPNVELYCKLLYLTEYTMNTLEKLGMSSKNLTEGAKEYKKLLELLVSCSVKELNNKELTENEKKQLLWFGGTAENISQDFLSAVSDSTDTKEMADFLVTDIASARDKNLSLGTGFFDEIYVVVPVGGKLYLAKGSVYSHYEFVSDKRLTDEEWWKMNGIHKIADKYGSYFELKKPSKDLPAQPKWISTFKSDKNKVKVTSQEVDFNKLKE
jgi:hypothetical protein